MSITMTAGELVAELRGRQWVVRDVEGATVGWISPAGEYWSLSLLSGGAGAGRFFTARGALEALASGRM
ncbi:hypothetical protein [Demequina silvatica]|uniref:hypothetical protein n=1 Tax=Demequina silvatica TaxID=1638988 RepID=UPI0012E01A55|nr:hypothetical protein [Demequina silvatica]